MRLLREITYGEFSEFVQEKKVHIRYIIVCHILIYNTHKNQVDDNDRDIIITCGKCHFLVIESVHNLFEWPDLMKWHFFIFVH